MFLVIMDLHDFHRFSTVLSRLYARIVFCSNPKAIVPNALSVCVPLRRIETDESHAKFTTMNHMPNFHRCIGRSRPRVTVRPNKQTRRALSEQTRFSYPAHISE